MAIDGEIIEGSCSFDTKTITGESNYKDAKVGDKVYGGFVSVNGSVKVKAEKSYSESTLKLIVDIVEQSAIKKSKNYKKDVAEKSILVTSDTVVVVDNIILGKPKNVQEAKEFLRLLSSKTHKVITGCCLKTHNNKIKYFSEQTVVKFKELTEEEIDFYVNKYKPFDKAGAYGIQEWIGAIGIENIQGDYYNVVGFPCYKFFELAKEITE